MERLPSLKAVHYFDAAVRYRSFTAAAQALHVTQSAISRMVQTLEEELQVQLFTRQGRMVTLTPAGSDYHRVISVALERIAQATERIRGHAAAQSLNLGVNPAFATRWLVPRLPDFQRKHPHIDLNFISNEIDSADTSSATTVWIRYGTGPWPGLKSTALPMDTPLAVVCSPELMRRYGEIKRPAELVDKPLLAYMGGTHDLWQDFFQHFDLPLSALAKPRRFRQLLMLAEAAVSGLGFALVPQFLVDPELGSGRLVQAMPGTFEFGRRHFILHSAGADRDKNVMIFKRWLLDQARKQ